MVKIVKFRDNSFAIGNNDESFNEYVIDLQIDRESVIDKQSIVCKDEVDEFIKTGKVRV